MAKRDARYWDGQRRGGIIVAVMAFAAACLGLFNAAFAYWFSSRIPARSIGTEYRERALWDVGLAGVCLAGGIGFVFYARRAHRRARILRNECLGCGYNLKALPDPRCPECGTAFNPKDYPALSALRPERHSE